MVFRLEKSKAYAGHTRLMFYVIAVTFCVNSLSGQRKFSRAYQSKSHRSFRGRTCPPPEPHKCDTLNGERPYFAIVSGVSRVLG